MQVPRMVARKEVEIVARVGTVVVEERTLAVAVVGHTRCSFGCYSLEWSVGN